MSKWISVEDELPAVGEAVLIKYKDTVQNITYCRQGGFSFDPWFKPYYFDDDEIIIKAPEVSEWIYISDIK